MPARPPVGDTPAQTEREIAATRQRMAATLDELELAVREVLDWQGRVRRQPSLYAGIALAAGFIAAGGPGRLFKHTYWRVRPSARRKAEANQYLLRLQTALDQTLGGLPTSVAETARQLRVQINRADRTSRPDGTIVIEQKGSAFEQMAVRAAEAAAAAAAALVTKRLLDEMAGPPPEPAKSRK